MLTKINIDFLDIIHIFSCYGIIFLLDILILCSKIKLELKTCPLIMRIVHFIFPPIMWGNMIYLLLIKYHFAIRIIVLIITFIIIYGGLVTIGDLFFCLHLHNKADRELLRFIGNLLGFLFWFSMPICGLIQNLIGWFRQKSQNN